MDNKELIHKFYTSFANGDYKGMLACYHKDVVFQDPAFGVLKGNRAFKMWEMLLSSKNAKTHISFDNVQANAESGKATWIAAYFYGDKKRKVVNQVSASFLFKEGKIIAHTDTFDLWKWSKQALGVSGFVLGWSSFMKNKIQQTTSEKLDEFINR